MDLRVRLVRDVFSTTFLNGIGKGVGLLIPFFVAAWYGAGSATDAFFLSYSLILAFSEFLSPAFQNVLVPFIVETRNRPEELGDFLGGVAAFGTAAVAVLLGLFLALAAAGLPLFLPRGSGQPRLILIPLLEISAMAVLSMWSGFLSGILNAFKRFALPAISPLFRAVVALGVIAAAKGRLGIHALALGYVLGEACRAAILGLRLGRLKPVELRFRLRPAPRVLEFFKVGAFQSAGLAFLGLNIVIDKVMASWLGDGRVSVLHYADRLTAVPLVFILSGVFVPLISHWSESFHASGAAGLKSELKKALITIGILAAVLAGLAILFRRPIVALALARGAMSEPDVREVGAVFGFYLPGLLPQVLGAVFLRAHMILKNTRRIMVCAGTMAVLKIGFNLVFMRILGLSGIALATSLLQVFFLFCLGASFYRKCESMGPPAALSREGS